MPSNRDVRSYNPLMGSSALVVALVAVVAVAVAA
jgi:hypothetical protein